MRNLSNTEPSNISSAPRKEGFQFTSVYGNPKSSPSFNFGASRNATFNFGSAPKIAGFEFGGTPQNAGFSFGNQHSGGLMGFGSKPRSEGLFGSSNTAGTGFSFGSSVPSNQSPSMFGSSNNRSGFTFGKDNHK